MNLQNLYFNRKISLFKKVFCKVNIANIISFQNELNRKLSWEYKVLLKSVLNLSCIRNLE